MVVTKPSVWKLARGPSERKWYVGYNLGREGRDQKGNVIGMRWVSSGKGGR